jgi:alanyl-tRNA synthetase
MEIWNLVFMQFNRTQPDPTYTGQYDEPLPAPGVDTGMGFERLVSVIQGTESNYETDLFLPIIERTQQIAGHTDKERDADIIPYRVIADHVRSAVFLIADGVLPGAKGRDSVCRLVIRRAARFGSKIGFNEPFLSKVADAVIEVMGEHYTEIAERAETIKRTITREEERFRRTLDVGVTELETMLSELLDGGELPGDKAFYLKILLKSAAIQWICLVSTQQLKNIRRSVEAGKQWGRLMQLKCTAQFCPIYCHLETCQITKSRTCLMVIPP